MNNTHIFSVFGQIEVAVADQMIEEGKATRIDYSEIPEEVRFNDAGKRAYYAVMIKGKKLLTEFNKRIEDLRA